MDLTSEPFRLLGNSSGSLLASKDSLLSGTAGGFDLSDSAGGFVRPDEVDGEGLADADDVPLGGRTGVIFAAAIGLLEGDIEVDLGGSGGADDVDDFQPMEGSGLALTGEVGEIGFL